MDIFQEFILAIIQALLEWLPVSSEGFVMLTAINIFGDTADNAIRIAIWFHLGTAIAVFIKYRQTYYDAFFKDRTLLRMLFLSVLGTAVIGIPLYFLLNDIFSVLNGMIVTLIIGVTLAITATFLRFGKLKGSETRTIENRKVGDELALGIAQGFAILPGISRSGTTMTYLILRGYRKEDAFKISFLISLPAVLAAIAFDFLITVVVNNEQIGFNWYYLILMGIVAIIGYFMMDFLLKFAKKYSFDIICYILSAFTIGLAIIYFIFV